MSFPPATEMFQFAGFASHGYGFTVRYPLPGGLPHSEIPGSKGARASPGLFAACHVLHRLSTPRHSPDALRSLAPLQQRAPSCTKAHVVSSRWQSHPLSRPAAKPPASCCSRTSVPARAGTAKNKHTMLGDHPPRAPAAMANHPCVDPAWTNSCDQRPRTPTRHQGEPRTSSTIDRVARARPDLPLHDLKEHSPEHPTDTATAAADRNDRENHVTCLSPSGGTNMPNDGQAHAIGWWAWADLNSRPHAYQACALTN